MAERRTRVVPVDPLRPNPAAIAEAAGILRAGGLVAFPTETVYGLGGNAFDEAAVAAIFAAKERDASDPLIVHLAAAEELSRVARDVPKVARLLVERFWPGPLTLVLGRGDAVATAVSAGLDSVAVRVPTHAVAHALIAAAGVPVAAPSANRFMRTSATTAAHVLEDLDGRIDLVLDGGPATGGIESTVVAFEGDLVRILRPGAVSAEALAATPGIRLAGPRDDFAAGRVRSPGMLQKHYAPRTPLVYVAVPGDAGRAVLIRELRAAVAAGHRVGLLVMSEDAVALAGTPATVVHDLGAAADTAAIARRLFAGLRTLDRAAVDRIMARSFGTEGLGAALDDRLRRAAERVVTA